jgi:hypothetical protein
MADSPEFFLDESMLARALYDLLTQRGHTVHRSGIEVPRGASDRDWLQALGSRPWIVLMREPRPYLYTNTRGGSVSPANWQ